MKRQIPLTSLCGLSLCILSSLVSQAHAESVLVRGGTLIDGTGAPAVAAANVLITDGMITSVWSGNAGGPAIPDGTEVIDAEGKFIIPGLIDSHVHYAWWEGELFINHGVTSVYSMGGGNNTLTALRKGIELGQIVGPRMFASAGLPGGAASRVEGINPAGGREIREGPGVINAPSDAAAVIAALKDSSNPPIFVTVNESWNGEFVKAVTEAAHENGLAVMSHSYDVLDSSDWGIRGIEHMTGIGIAAITDPEGKASASVTYECPRGLAPVLLLTMTCLSAGWKNSLLYRWMDPKVFDEMVQHLVANGTYINPTLTFEWKGVTERKEQFELEDTKLWGTPALQYAPADERNLTLWQYHWTDLRTAEDRAEFRRGYANVQEFLRKFVAAGGKVYSGTDTAAALTPGLSLHHEMQLLVDAGIPEMNALQASTLWAAEWTGMDKLIGTVEAGKYGDVVVLAANPLDDIHNTQSVVNVIKGGVVQKLGYNPSYESTAPFRESGPVSKHLYNQPPLITGIAPDIAPQGSDVWVKLTGRHYAPNSVVLFDGQPVETSFGGDDEILGRLSPAQTARAGSYLITVSTPIPGGGIAEGSTFVVDYP
jgi:hypothetical protein